MSKKKTRRLAAIMFTDIAGYTRLMQESEARAAQIRQRHREIFEYYHEQYNGQILQYYGDGTLSIFDSCVEAVQCAVRMQQDLQKAPVVPLRIGVHLGDIVKAENDIYGDGVNVAARVESLGVPGAVLISGQVRQQIKNQEIEAISMGSFAMKNVATPLEVFAIRANGLITPKGGDLKGKAKRLSTASATLAKTKRWVRLAIIGFVVMALGATLFWTLIGGSLDRGGLSTEEKIKWAYQTAIPKIDSLVENLYIHQNNTGYGPHAWEAFTLVQEVEKILPDDPKVLELKSKCSGKIHIHSKPDGVKVYAKPYSKGDTAFQYMGTTPIENAIFPSSYISLKLEKEGFESIRDVILIAESPVNHWTYTLDTLGAIPENMSMIRPHLEDTLLLRYSRLGGFLNNPDNFLVDQYEVSNREYMAFVQAGGYRNRQYWKEPIYDETGAELSWEEATSRFVDDTGLPGPSAWTGGSYPKAEGDYPVEGVSWYEAAAYAEFIGKQLPSIFHLGYLKGNAWVLQEMIESSHLNQTRTRARSKDLAENLWGVHDLFGNVREWCYNSKGKGIRVQAGASYNDEDYRAVEFGNYGAPPIDRSKGNGFRCIKSFHFPNYEGPLYREITINRRRDYSKELPVSDAQFEAFLRQFYYDKQKMDPKEIYSNDEEHWIRKKVSFDAPYGNERMTAYLFLPKNAAPPFQTLVYWPGSTATRMNSSEEFLEIGQVDFLIKNGRAIIFPIIAGTYERKNAAETGCKDWKVCHKIIRIKHVQEFQKTLDYLETRTDIDMEKIAFIGKSWGGALGPMPMAVDQRFKVGIFHLGGLYDSRPLPEVDPFNYYPRVKQPVLMLHGKFDPNRPYKEALLPAFKLLGTPEEDKDLKLYNEAHMVPKKNFIKESLGFLDRYFGPVKFLPN